MLLAYIFIISSHISRDNEELLTRHIMTRVTPGIQARDTHPEALSILSESILHFHLGSQPMR